MDRITDKVPSLRLGCRNYHIHVTVDISKEDEHKHNHHYDNHYDHHYDDLNWVIVLIRESETWPLETWSVERFADCSIDRRLFSRLLNCNLTNTSSALTGLGISHSMFTRTINPSIMSHVLGLGTNTKTNLAKPVSLSISAQQMYFFQNYL